MDDMNNEIKKGVSSFLAGVWHGRILPSTESWVSPCTSPIDSGG